MRSKYDEETSCQEERFQRILAEMGINLRERQDRVQLAPQIWELERSLEYIRDQIEVIEVETEGLIQEISAREPDLEVLCDQIIRLQEERRIIIGPSSPACLEVLEQTHAEHKAVLTRLELKIREGEAKLPALEYQIRELEVFLGSLQATVLDTGRVVANLRDRRSILEDEIQAGSVTRDLLAGQLPVGVDSVWMASIQDNLQAYLDIYRGHIQENMERISRDIKALQVELEACHNMEDILVGRKEELARQFFVLSQEVDSHQSAEILAIEVAELSRSLEEHTMAAVDTRRAAATCAEEVTALDQDLVEVEAQLLQSQKRHDALKAVQETLELGTDLSVATTALLEHSVAVNAECRLQENLTREARLLIERLEQQRSVCEAICEPWRETMIAFDRVVAEWMEA